MRHPHELCLFTALLVLLISQPAWPLIINTPYVSGVWTSEDSPVYVMRSITLLAGDELIIEPGVEVRFAGHYWFRVEGVLVAAGAPGDSILFTSDQPEEYHWLGIRFDQSEPGSMLEYCILEWSTTVMDPGAGIRVESCSPRIRNCTVRHCESGGDGGGIYLHDSHTQILDCRIAFNSNHDNGGGIMIDGGSASVSGCDISHNSAYAGGGLYTGSGGSYTVTGCSITNNYASDYGGGIYAGGAVTVEDCNITDNESGLVGGGVSLTGGTIRACNISDNMSSSGGGIYVLTFGIIEHTTITGNSAPYSSGGAIFSSASNLTLDHTTVCFNHARDCSGLQAVHSDVLLKDSIFAFNTPGPEISVEEISTVTITFCDIMGGPEQVQVDLGIVNWLVGNIFKDPLFCDQVPLLEDCSPCLGAGSGGSNIGRGAAGCPCGDPTGVGEDETETTWGRIKQMFR